jgi:hypothetical protein
MAIDNNADAQQHRRARRDLVIAGTSAAFTLAAAGLLGAVSVKHEIQNQVAQQTAATATQNTALLKAPLTSQHCTASALLNGGSFEVCTMSRRSFDGSQDLDSYQITTNLGAADNKSVRIEISFNTAPSAEASIRTYLKEAAAAAFFRSGAPAPVCDLANGDTGILTQLDSSRKLFLDAGIARPAPLARDYRISYTPETQALLREARANCPKA